MRVVVPEKAEITAPAVTWARAAAAVMDVIRDTLVQVMVQAAVAAELPVVTRVTRVGAGLPDTHRLAGVM